MRNITITVPDQAYRRARIWVAHRDISVSAVVAYLLDSMLKNKSSFHTVPASTGTPGAPVDEFPSN